MWQGLTQCPLWWSAAEPTKGLPSSLGLSSSHLPYHCPARPPAQETAGPNLWEQSPNSGTPGFRKHFFKTIFKERKKLAGSEGKRGGVQQLIWGNGVTQAWASSVYLGETIV